MKINSRLSILFIGDLWYGSTALQRKNAFLNLGHEVIVVDSTYVAGILKKFISRVLFKFKYLPDYNNVNRIVKNEVMTKSFDLIWFDKGLLIRKKTLAEIKKIQPETILISFSPDDMLNKSNQTNHYLKSINKYDLHITTKSFNVAELIKLGAKDVFYTMKSFDSSIHKPLILNENEIKRFQTDVGFIGNYEDDRAKKILFICNNEINVRVCGANWKPLQNINTYLKIDPKNYWGLDYSKIINATKINLGFLSKANRDLHTARSVEIPACGGFLLAERTDEHLSLFKEGVEAEFFSSDLEMVDKINYYMKNDSTREQIAMKGYERCIEDGYNNENRLKKIIKYISANFD